MTIIRIDHIDPTFANRPRTTYIACGEIFEVSDNYDKEGRLLSKNAKVTMKSGKTYIVNESVTSLVTRIGQECPAPVNIAGPQGPNSFPFSVSATSNNSGVVSVLAGTLYLKTGTISNTSTAYIDIQRTNGNNGAQISGFVTIETTDQQTTPVTMTLSTTSTSAESETSTFTGNGIIVEGWYKVFINAQGSSVVVQQQQDNDTCTATLYGIHLVYQ